MSSDNLPGAGTSTTNYDNNKDDLSLRRLREGSMDSDQSSTEPPSPTRSVRSPSVIAWGVRASSSASGRSSLSESSIRLRAPSVRGKTAASLLPPQRSESGELSPNPADESRGDNTTLLTPTDPANSSRTPSPISDHAESSNTGASAPYFSASGSSASLPRTRTTRFQSLGSQSSSTSRSPYSNPKSPYQVDARITQPNFAAQRFVSSESLTVNITDKRKARYFPGEMTEFGALPASSVVDLTSSNFGGSTTHLATQVHASSRKPVPESPPRERSTTRHSAPALFSIGEGIAGGVQRDEKGKKINVVKWQQADPLNNGMDVTAEPTTGLKNLKRRFSASVNDLFGAHHSSGASRTDNQASAPHNILWKTASGMFGTSAKAQGSTADLAIPWEIPESSSKRNSLRRLSVKFRPSEHSPVPQRLSPRESAQSKRKDSAPLPSAVSNAGFKYNALSRHSRNMSTPDLRLPALQAPLLGPPVTAAPARASVSPRVLQWVSTTQNIVAKPEMTPIDSIPQGVDLGFRRGSVAPSDIPGFQARFSITPAPPLEEEDSDDDDDIIEEEEEGDEEEPSAAPVEAEAPGSPRIPNRSSSRQVSISTLASIFTTSNSKSTSPSSAATQSSENQSQAKTTAVEMVKPASAAVPVEDVAVARQNKRWSKSGIFSKFTLKSSSKDKSFNNASNLAANDSIPPSILVNGIRATIAPTPESKSLSRFTDGGDSLAEIPKVKDLTKDQTLPTSFRERLLDERSDFGLPLDFGSTDFLADDIMRAMERRNSFSSFVSDLSGCGSSMTDAVSDAVIEKAVVSSAPFYSTATTSRGSRLNLSHLMIAAN